MGAACAVPMIDAIAIKVSFSLFHFFQNKGEPMLSLYHLFNRD